MKQRLSILLPFFLSTIFIVGSSYLETAGIFSTAATAAAEDVRASRSAAVMASPGEQARVVTRVRSGTKMSVISKKGRWMKVRVNGRTGWITRSNVADSQARTPVSNRRRRAFVEGRSTRRKSVRSAPSDRTGRSARSRSNDDFADDFEEQDDFEEEDFSDDDFDDDDDFEDDFEDEAPAKKAKPKLDTVVVLASVRVRQKSSRRSKSMAKARAGDKLMVLQRRGEWMKVKTRSGDTGWVQNKYVEDGYRYKPYTVRFHGGLGYSNLGQSFSTPDEQYVLGSGAIAVGIGADVIYNYDADFLIAGDFNYQYSSASPGIQYNPNPADPTMATNISFQNHRIDIGARGGYKVYKPMGMAVYARAGFHYNNFGIDNVEDLTINLPMIPSEILSGGTLGVMVDAPWITPKIAARIGIDVLAVGGARVQTLGLEDGLQSDASGMWGSARVDYQYKPSWKLSAQYFYSGLDTTWTGQAPNSKRPAKASAQREDKIHAMFIGASKAL